MSLLKFQRRSSPGMTRSKFELQTEQFELQRHLYILPREIADAEANPSRFNLIKVKVRHKAIADTEARVAKCQARVDAEAAQEVI